MKRFPRETREITLKIFMFFVYFAGYPPFTFLWLMYYVAIGMQKIRPDDYLNKTKGFYGGLSFSGLE